ncbi:response regulator [uncultured Chitinophaga sp.]|uniref:response regulator n=1 Tax=uncultured Chitinophaga sp. TaxID=339340 RepID=UPI0025D229ED|nr:response regulator [uncultured Chitinophaga sp.]
MIEESKFILYAEDDTDDYLFFKSSLANVRPEYQLIRASNGLDAVDYLGSIRDGNPVPELIVMDYNMPVMNGFHALKIIRSMEEYRDIPLVLFTTSTATHELEEYHNLNIGIFWKGISLELLGDQIIEMLALIGKR